MGVVLCEKHKKSGGVLTCIHLSNKVWKFQEISDFVKRDERENSDGEYDWLKGHRIYCLCKYCDNEFSNLKFEDFSGDYWKLSCEKCFIELSDLENWY